MGSSGKTVTEAWNQVQPGSLTLLCAPQMWMSARLGTRAKMASARTHQAPSNVSASLAIICLGTGATVRVRDPRAWALACSYLPQDLYCPGPVTIQISVVV